MRKPAPRIECPNCSRVIARGSLLRHMRSDACLGRPRNPPVVCRHGIAWPCDVCWCVELFEKEQTPEEVSARTGLPLVRVKAYLRGHYGFQIAKRLMFVNARTRAEMLEDIKHKLVVMSVEKELRRRGVDP